MFMTPVNSSNLVAVGYDSSSSTLRIEFHNGTYDYYDVPTNIYQGLLNSSSKGSYHASYIKDAYRYRRV
jgi:hypothetical protein